MDHDKLVRTYLNKRAQRAELKKDYDELDGQLKGDMELIEATLLRSLLDNKVNSMGAKDGTFFIERTIKPSCTDWHAYRQWMIENDALDGVEKRVTKSFIADYMKEHDEEVPPGIAVLREQVVRVRTINT